MSVPASGDSRNSLRLRTRISRREGSAATSLGSTICQRPRPASRRSKTRCSLPRSIATRRISCPGVSIRSGSTRSARRAVVPLRAEPGSIEPPHEQEEAEEQHHQNDRLSIRFHVIIRAGQRRR